MNARHSVTRCAVSASGLQKLMVAAQSEFLEAVMDEMIIAKSDGGR